MRLDNWAGQVYINGVNTLDLSSVEGPVTIHLIPKRLVPTTASVSTNEPDTNDQEQGSFVQEIADTTEYRVYVKEYMIHKATPSFDFMARWNQDNPMPLRIMTGIKDKETPKMVHMVLHGDMYARQMPICMRCGKPLTNPVSQYFGIGPECGHHGYVNPFDSDEELMAAVSSYKTKLLDIQWTGWIPKSAILEEKAV